jgi:hypothetical protein
MTRISALPATHPHGCKPPLWRSRQLLVFQRTYFLVTAFNMLLGYTIDWTATLSAPSKENALRQFS